MGHNKIKTTALYYKRKTTMIIIRNIHGDVIAKEDWETLYNIHLTGMDLHEADFRGADLSMANLDYADLSGADLTDANLNNASMCGTILDDAILDGAELPLPPIQRGYA